MSTEVTDEEIEKVLLEKLRDDLVHNPGLFTIKELCSCYPSTLNNYGKDEQRRVLTGIYDLFRNGYLAWGHDLEEPNPPLCHITHWGKEKLNKEI